MCTEAGLLALRERRMRVTQADFSKSRDKVRCDAQPDLMPLRRRLLHLLSTLHHEAGWTMVNWDVQWHCSRMIRQQA